MTRPFFNKERISHFDVFATHADDAINQAKARLAEGYPIDYQVLIQSPLPHIILTPAYPPEGPRRPFYLGFRNRVPLR